MGASPFGSLGRLFGACHGGMRKRTIAVRTQASSGMPQLTHLIGPGDGGTVLFAARTRGRGGMTRRFGCHVAIGRQGTPSTTAFGMMRRRGWWIEGGGPSESPTAHRSNTATGTATVLRSSFHAFGNGLNPFDVEIVIVVGGGGIDGLAAVRGRRGAGLRRTKAIAGRGGGGGQISRRGSPGRKRNIVHH